MLHMSKAKVAFLEGWPFPVSQTESYGTVMVRLYHKHQENATEIDTRQLLR